MPRNRRDRREPNRIVVHTTNRTWEGLPFVPNRSMRRILKGVIARGQMLFPVTICAYLFMGNHYHFVLAGDGKRISQFMGYIDGEIARRMMRLMPGRWGSHFWEGRFHEEHLPTPQAVVNKIIYVFCNPLRARLVSSLKTYPGASSAQSLSAVDGKTSELCSFTHLRHFTPLKGSHLSAKADGEWSMQLQKKTAGFHSLTTDLFAWTRCFNKRVCKTELLQQINCAIHQAETAAEAQGCIGAERLRYQPFNKPHRAKKKGISPFLTCPDIELRKILIASYRDFVAECRRAWQRVKGGLSAEWPRGSFVPGRYYSLLTRSP